MAHSTTLPPATALPALEIYLLLGQSNMVGMDPSYVQGEREPHARIYLLDAKGQWVPAAEPLHGVGVGPGLTFATLMAAHRTSASIGLLPLAVGSTPISQWVKGSANYQATLSRVAVARQHGVVRGILWHQGESDSYDAALAAAYPAQLTQFVRDLRADLDAPDLPFVCGELGHFLGSAHRDAVSSATLALPAQLPAVAAVRTEGLTNMDPWHFDAASARTLGRRYYEAMLRLQAGAEAEAHSAAE